MDLTAKPDIADTMNEPAPSAHGDPMGTPAADDTVLWRGRPDLAVLARTAFHSRKVALYFAALVAISALLGNTNTAIVCAVLAVLVEAILYGLAWVSRRTTLYILTDTRLIMRIGMALETRVNIPLHHIKSADLRSRGKRHGDIALTIGGERLLGYWLLWPHARPWRFTHPQPMLRAVPEAEKVAALLADTCAQVATIERDLTGVKDEPANAAIPAKEAHTAPRGRFGSGEFEGAPA